jgi:hypothetical protein
MPKRRPATPATPEEAQAAFDALHALLEDAERSRVFREELEKALLQSLEDDPPKTPPAVEPKHRKRAAKASAPVLEEEIGASDTAAPREVLRFHAHGRARDEWGALYAVAELMRCQAVRIEVGRTRHLRRTFTIDDPMVGGIRALPVTRVLLTATFLDLPARERLAHRMEDCGFAYVRDGRRLLRDWVPLDVGGGYVPLGFFVQRAHAPRDDRDLEADLELLQKFLRVRTDLVFKLLAGRRGWHITTFHWSAQDAEDFRLGVERQMPGIFEFD